MVFLPLGPTYLGLSSNYLFTELHFQLGILMKGTQVPHMAQILLTLHSQGPHLADWLLRGQCLSGL